MTLPDFILDNTEAILVEWEKFAATVLPAANMGRTALRDEAARILRRIAEDMRRPQSDSTQESKSKGGEPRRGSGDSPAELHADERLAHGFNLDEMVSEYRALRASVIRLWTRDVDKMDRDGLYEMTRFNEALDQALVESITRYSAELSRSRELFLGVLGHDLRSPLQSISLSAAALARDPALASDKKEAAVRIGRSAERIDHLVNDLLDVVRTRLGGTLPLKPVSVDLRPLCEHIVDEVQASHPNRAFALQLADNLRGTWDEGRLGQLFSNLLENAVEHGSVDAPVTVSAHGDGANVVVSVHNQGPPLPKNLLHRIFDPLVRADTDGPSAQHLGLGLYIAREIVQAHGGSVDVESSSDVGTTFIVNLPRQALAAYP